MNKAADKKRNADTWRERLHPTTTSLACVWRLGGDVEKADIEL